ncbi:MAG TPA: type II toxin-antitoxin system PemK/MazF family toxin [Kofleriaceae bacterium]|nr:type II toxin-antitoxin system PemK/MazF family toxin [Kofleriaceae bacterium]
MRRGEIWEAELRPRSGSEQSGRRPVLVISNDGFNEIEAWRSVVVVPCSTSDAQRARGPTAVPLKEGAGGLRKGSVVVCHQVTTLDRAKLVTRWGALDANELAAVEDGLRAALDL